MEELFIPDFHSPGNISRFTIDPSLYGARHKKEVKIYFTSKMALLALSRENSRLFRRKSGWD